MGKKTTKAPAVRTYRVRRSWTVTMESWCEVEAADATEACRLALDGDDYDDQEIADGSDGPTYIDAIEIDGDRIAVPEGFGEDGDGEGVPPGTARAPASGSWTILVHGNPVDGYEFTGPFTDEAAAADYGEQHTGGGWSIATMDYPAMESRRSED